MKFTPTRITLAVALATLAASAQAQTAGKPPSGGTPTQLPPVVVTGNPLGSDTFELVQPTSVLDGRDLMINRKSTLGETLSELPGVSSSYFGPNSSRPVIRGFDGDKIRILQNGAAMLDASALAPDHAVAVDPLVIDRVEVVRGPATLLYGGNAIGGVVNVLDNRIPQSAITGLGGRMEGRLGGADNERGGVGVFEGGNGQFAVHADAYGRGTDDLKIPGYARSARLRASGSTFGLPDSGVEQVDRLGNTNAHSYGGALGGALTSNRGYAGLSAQQFQANYGSPLELGSRIDMQSTRWDFGGEARDLGTVIESVKVKAGYTDYQHTESDEGVPQTTFKNRGYDARIEALHGKLGPLKGAIGLQLTNFDFSALGAEAFIPQTNTDAKGLFIYEEWPIGKLKLVMGGRAERNQVQSNGGGPVDPSTGNPRFDPAQTRSFTPKSGALGLVYSVTHDIALAANLAHTERAPTYSELYGNGPHDVTGQFEIGDATLAPEKSNSLDAALRMRSGPHSGSIGVFRSRFSNFVTLFNTGNQRCPDGSVPADSDGDGVPDCAGEDILPEAQFRGVPAIFEGFEAQGRFRLYDRSGALDLIAQASYVKAYNETTDEPLPRIPPLKLMAGLDYQFNQFGARLDVINAQGQDRVSANELPTDGYTLVNASLYYHLKDVGFATWEAFLRVNNLFDREARDHTSTLKDIAPLPGRGVMAGLRGSF
jgi:iron complex outermembrane receptor protein